MIRLESVLLLAMDIVKGPYVHCAAPAGYSLGEPSSPVRLSQQQQQQQQALWGERYEPVASSGKGKKCEKPRPTEKEDEGGEDAGSASYPSPSTPSPRHPHTSPSQSSPPVDRMFGLSDVFVPRPEFCHRVMWLHPAESGRLYLYYPEEIPGEHYQRKTLRYSLCFVFRVDQTLMTIGEGLTRWLIQPYSIVLTNVVEELRDAEVKHRYMSRGLDGGTLFSPDARSHENKGHSHASSMLMSSPPISAVGGTACAALSASTPALPIAGVGDSRQQQQRQQVGVRGDNGVLSLSAGRGTSLYDSESVSVSVSDNTSFGRRQDSHASDGGRNASPGNHCSFRSGTASTTTTTAQGSCVTPLSVVHGQQALYQQQQQQPAAGSIGESTGLFPKVMPPSPSDTVEPAHTSTMPTATTMTAATVESPNSLLRPTNRDGNRGNTDPNGKGESSTSTSGGDGVADKNAGGEKVDNKATLESGNGRDGLGPTLPTAEDEQTPLSVLPTDFPTSSAFGHTPPQVPPRDGDTRQQHSHRAGSRPSLCSSEGAGKGTGESSGRRRHHGSGSSSNAPTGHALSAGGNDTGHAGGGAGGGAVSNVLNCFVTPPTGQRWTSLEDLVQALYECLREAEEEEAVASRTRRLARRSAAMPHTVDGLSPHGTQTSANAAADGALTALPDNATRTATATTAGRAAVGGSADRDVGAAAAHPPRAGSLSVVSLSSQHSSGSLGVLSPLSLVSREDLMKAPPIGNTPRHRKRGRRVGGRGPAALPRGVEPLSTFPPPANPPLSPPRHREGALATAAAAAAASPSSATMMTTTHTSTNSRLHHSHSHKHPSAATSGMIPLNDGEQAYVPVAHGGRPIWTSRTTRTESQLHELATPIPAAATATGKHPGNGDGNSNHSNSNKGRGRAGDGGGGDGGAPASQAALSPAKDGSARGLTSSPSPSFPSSSLEAALALLEQPSSGSLGARQVGTFEKEPWEAKGLLRAAFGPARIGAEESDDDDSDGDDGVTRRSAIGSDGGHKQAYGDATQFTPAETVLSPRASRFFKKNRKVLLSMLREGSRDKGRRHDDGDGGGSLCGRSARSTQSGSDSDSSDGSCSSSSSSSSASTTISATTTFSSTGGGHDSGSSACVVRNALRAPRNRSIVSLSDKIFLHVRRMPPLQPIEFIHLDQVPIPIVAYDANAFEWMDLAVHRVFQLIDGQRTVADIVFSIAVGTNTTLREVFAAVSGVQPDGDEEGHGSQQQQQQTGIVEHEALAKNASARRPISQCDGGAGADREREAKSQGYARQRAGAPTAAPNTVVVRLASSLTARGSVGCIARPSSLVCSSSSAGYLPATPPKWASTGGGNPPSPQHGRNHHHHHPIPSTSATLDSPSSPASPWPWQRGYQHQRGGSAFDTTMHSAPTGRSPSGLGSTIVTSASVGAVVATGGVANAVGGGNHLTTNRSVVAANAMPSLQVNVSILPPVKADIGDNRDCDSGSGASGRGSPRLLDGGGDRTAPLHRQNSPSRHRRRILVELPHCWEAASNVVTEALLHLKVINAIKLLSPWNPHTTIYCTTPAFHAIMRDANHPARAEMGVYMLRVAALEKQDHALRRTWRKLQKRVPEQEAQLADLEEEEEEEKRRQRQHSLAPSQERAAAAPSPHRDAQTPGLLPTRPPLPSGGGASGAISQLRPPSSAPLRSTSTPRAHERPPPLSLTPPAAAETAAGIDNPTAAQSRPQQSAADSPHLHATNLSTSLPSLSDASLLHSLSFNGQRGGWNLTLTAGTTHNAARAGRDTPSRRKPSSLAREYAAAGPQQQQPQQSIPQDGAGTGESVEHSTATSVQSGGLVTAAATLHRTAVVVAAGGGEEYLRGLSQRRATGDGDGEGGFRRCKGGAAATEASCDGECTNSDTTFSGSSCTSSSSSSSSSNSSFWSSSDSASSFLHASSAVSAEKAASGGASRPAAMESHRQRECHHRSSSPPSRPSSADSTSSSSMSKGRGEAARPVPTAGTKGRRRARRKDDGGATAAATRTANTNEAFATVEEGEGAFVNGIFQRRPSAEVGLVASAVVCAVGKLTNSTMAAVRAEMRLMPAWGAVFNSWSLTCCKALVEMGVLNGWLQEVGYADSSSS